MGQRKPKLIRNERLIKYVLLIREEKKRVNKKQYFKKS